MFSSKSFRTYGPLDIKIKQDEEPYPGDDYAESLLVQIQQDHPKNYYSNLNVKDGKLSVTWTELGSLLYNNARPL